MSAQEPLDSSNHRTAMTVLLKIPQPLVTRQVGPRQPETHEDKMQAEQLQGLDLGSQSSLKIKARVCYFHMTDFEMEEEVGYFNVR